MPARGTVSDAAADPSAGRTWEDAESIRLTQEPAVIDFERQIADTGGKPSVSFFFHCALLGALIVVLCVCGRACATWVAGLSAGTELLTVRYLSFAAPSPPSFEYICCNELVGTAAKWTPSGEHLIKQGRAGAEQVRSLQHTLDRRGRAYDEVTGRLRFARDVIYEMPSSIPNSSACACV